MRRICPVTVGNYESGTAVGCRCAVVDFQKYHFYQYRVGGTDRFLSAAGASGRLAWLLESFCIVAVNVYMLISGYFLSVSSFRPSRLVQLWLQVWSYSIAIGLLGALTGVMEETAFDTHFLLTLLFPISMDHYWFLTAYFFLYLLLPFLGTAVRHMTKRQLQIAALCCSLRSAYRKVSCRCGWRRTGWGMTACGMCVCLWPPLISGDSESAFSEKRAAAPPCT